MLNSTVNNHRIKLFNRFSLVTVVVIFLLIFIGGIVRSTGSGMGCPDWPKCFGQYVPPTSVEELPADYKIQYAEIRKQKNERFAKVAQLLGYDEFAERILTDPSVYEEADFNAVKTWTEYINRLFGALTGLFILLTTVFAFLAFKWNTPFFFAFGGLILVIVQGLLGAFVVSSNLTPIIITLHLILAFVVIAFLLAARVSARRKDFVFNGMSRASLLTLTGIFLIVLLIQIVFGTGVREEVDSVSKALGDENRGKWLRNLGSGYALHKTFSVAVGAMAFAVFYFVDKSVGALKPFALSLLLLTLFQILIGLVMNQFALPPAAQTLHIGVSSLIFGAGFLIFAKLWLKPMPLQVTSKPN